MLKVFILITTIVMTNPDGANVSATSVIPYPMTEQDCKEVELATRADRIVAGLAVATQHGAVLKHVFGICKNVKKLLANSNGLKL